MPQSNAAIQVRVWSVRHEGVEYRRDPAWWAASSSAPA